MLLYCPKQNAKHEKRLWRCEREKKNLEKDNEARNLATERNVDKKWEHGWTKAHFN